jgi:hypothetical protein
VVRSTKATAIVRYYEDGPRTRCLPKATDKIMEAGKRFMFPPAAVCDTDGDEEAS